MSGLLEKDICLLLRPSQHDDPFPYDLCIPRT